MNYLLRDSKPERWFRLALSAAILIVGMTSLVRGYELAFSKDDDGFYRPDGYTTNGTYISVAVLAWFACFLGRRLRLLSWVMICALAWWANTTTWYYLHDLYYAMGQDGCLTCDDHMTELHLYTTGFALLCLVWAVVFKRHVVDRLAEISVFVIAWIILTMLVGANDG
ncbi:hypothetical protein [Rhizobium sp. BK376]|uniref:hypothetical protein n=1 Tax=Rhizobium sp. BK376 TaxID=2512149 RepID=UPI0010462855|nr:hypothetical protein [Rhizobium sp. BK376]TCR85238.1 hypothetical protein EV561_1079 [Rhizobium sp. BK376]